MMAFTDIDVESSIDRMLVDGKNSVEYCTKFRQVVLLETLEYFRIKSVESSEHGREQQLATRVEELACQQSPIEEPLTV